MSNDIVIASLKEKIDELNQQAWEARVNDSPKAFQLSQESVNLARSIDYAKGLAEGLRSLGFCYVRLSKNDEASPLLRESLSLFQSINDVKGQAVVYEYLGIIERNWGNLGASLELLLKGYALIQQVGSLEIEGTSCYQIGVTYKHLGNHENALDYLYRGLSIAKKSNNALMVAYSTNIIGSIYFDNGDYKDALDCYQRGLVIRRESHDKWGEAGSLDNIGFTYLKLNDLDKAIDYCKQSLKITQSTGDKKGEANTLLHLGEIFQQAGDIGQASKFSNESLAIRKERGDKRGEAEVLLFLADLHKDRGDVEDHQIFEWLRGALKIADEIKAQDLLSKARYNLHEYYTQKGNHKESLIQLEAHLQIEKELHKNTINQKISNLEISHKAEVIIQRNKELIELNEKIEKANAELKIEASLERVRAVAMSMKKPDDLLSICRILFTELEVLGIRDLRNAMINIYNDEKKTFLNYDFSGSLGQSITVFSMIHSHPVPDYITKQIREGKSHFAEIALTGDQLMDWIAFREKNGELPDPKLKNARTLCYYFYSVGAAAIGISTLSSITQREHETLMRFRNVFDLAYKRYTDIRQAEAQTREAQIEAALERVRAKSMAMHHSDDLITVINVVQEQLLGLGFHFHAANFVTDYSEKGYTMWLASPGESYPYKIYVPQVGLKYFEAVNAALEKGSDFATYSLNFEEKNIYFTKLFENSLAKNTSEEGKRIVFESKGMAASVVLLEKIRLNLMNLDMVPYTEEENNILKRFGYVFEQSYTRFLDLQKAEAQAREAQIEAAVEKVRSRSLAMHKSDELQEVVHTVFERLKELNVDFYTAIIILFREGSKDIIWWLESKASQQYPKMLVPFTPIPYFKDLFEIRESGGDLLSQCYSFDEKNELFRHLFENTEFKYVPESQKQFLLGAEFATISVALAKNTGIHITSYSKKSFSDQDIQIIKRFAKVFDQAYTRFLDLQKAEAQTKEAQTEVALERIRARAMAMHSSNELMDVAHILREQMGLLDQPDLETSVINLFDEDSDFIQSWHAFVEPGSSSGKTINGTVSFRKDSSELTKEMIGHYNSGKKEYTLEATGKKLNEFIQVLINSEPGISNYIGKNPPEKVFYHFATFKGGALLTVSYQPTTEDIKALQRRAASVFDMAYRRYRDLKKAEAQTREAQIEIAVERVRARALAMHMSEDLHSVVVTLKKELMGLQIPDITAATIYLAQDDGSIRVLDLSDTGEDDDDKPQLQLDKVFRLEDTDPKLWIRRMWERKENYFVLEADEDDFVRVVQFVRTVDPVGAEMAEKIIGEKSIKKAWLPTVKLQKGIMNIDLLAPPAPEIESILLKMGAGFDLAYKRFLDLQKAEAQAREAQIEAGLERVRSRSLAMHNTSELQDVIHAVHKELLNLNIAIHGGSFIAINRDVDTVLCCWGSGGTADTSQEVRLPLYEHPFCTNLINRIKTAPGFFTEEYTQQEKKDFFTFLFKHEPWSKLDAKQKNETLSSPGGYTRSCYVSQHTSIFIINHFGKKFSTADNDILQRFGKVFEQSYTRFLDLQKAEAQAREAQIETGLERVRSKTMAMHKSEEVTGVAVSLNEELLKLGFEGGSTIIIINRETGDTEQWTGFSEDKTIRSCYVPFFKHPYHDALLDSWKNGENFLVYTIAGDEKRSLDEHYFTTGYKIFPESDKKWMREMGSVTFSHAFMKYGAIHWGPAQLTEEQLRILQRFSKVFEQSYTRFLDLQKAEAQAREAQIEAALERVRAKVMAMTNSKELNATSLVFGEQIRKLSIDWQFSYFWLIDESKNENVFWITWPDYKTSFTSYTMAEAEEFFNDCLVSWRAGVKIHDNYVPPEGVQEWLDTFQRIADDAGGEAKKIMVAPTFPTGVYYYDAMMKYGSFGICINKPATDEEKKIQCRFAIEFERAYTRFLDLKQAEAQAREAQIETALERVRSRTMGMQRSGELPEAANLLFQQIQSLGINVFSTGYNIWENDKKSVTSWMASQGIIQPPFKLPLNEDTALIDCYKAARQGDTFFVQQLSGEKLISHLNYMSTLPVIGEIMKKMREAGISLPGYMINHHAFFSHGYLLFITYEQVPEAHDIFKRFAKVFEQTYTRFLDLQKAEAQAREAQIELGLERVRARAMAMQKSDELKELIGTVSTELSKLDLILDRCFIMTYDIKTSGATWWMANPETSSDPIGLYVKYHEHVPYLAFLKAWQDRVIKWQYILEGSVKKTWDEFLFAETELSRLPGFVIDNMRGQNKVYLSASFNNFGCLTLATLEPLSDEQFDIMLRFAKVFDLTYTRFNDLKQAEAQTREAKIEAALERVRSKAMAMHKSEDLNAAVATVFEELHKLNIGILRCGIAIMDKKKPRADVWITVKSEETNTVQVSGDESLDYHPLLRGAYDGWVKQEDFYYILEGEDLLSYYRDVASIKYQLPVSDPFDKEKMDQRQFYFNAVFQDGSLFAFMETAITEEAKMVMKRFANVFNLTYKRFLDLQKAEAQTREAKIEAALERVRARALAMQEPEELKDVAQVLRTEMGLLGVEELETCSIYINDEVTNKTECWYALKDLKEEGKKLVSDHFPLNLNDTWVGREMMNFYGSDAKQVSIVMQGSNRKEWINYCEEKSIPLRGYYGDIIPDRTYHLYKFSHGAIGAAAAGDISAESWKLLSRAASVFSLAYSRFKDLTQARNDLIKLKEEKTRAEDALTELQATQKQLIQSEKMASLGELTAGIAHEIQNPLNFVNNFSDVSNELLEEMKVELEKGNAAEAKAIAIDVKENLEKILHHGKRADAIVKGMLQHSRTSSGQKELTDINTLAEEYLRLAYHGLRAKDKFFNAKFETHLDPSIDKINVVPQEIGRVILNLINNAFYAVTEKKKSLHPSPQGVKGNTFNDYEPIVTVTTKRLGLPLGDKGSVEIRVADNGNGIPQKALDKIFQPFFTTKPTGQGTGLGLSLSYDIVTKGHDGEITVKTKEGEGAEFTITLPVN